MSSKRNRGGVDQPADYPRVLAYLATAGEAVMLEQFDRRAEEEPSLGLPTDSGLGDRLGETASCGCYLAEGTSEGGPSDALAAM